MSEFETENQTDSKPNQLTNMVFLLMKNYRFLKSTEGETFAQRVKPQTDETYGRPVSVSELTGEAMTMFYAAHNTFPKPQLVKEAMVAATATTTEAVKFHTRYAHIGGEIFIDMADELDRVIWVSPDGWEVLDKAPEGIYFKRTSLTAPMVVPRKDGNLMELRQIVNVNDEQWKLLVGWMLSAVMGTSRPILTLSGAQGATKTSTGTTLVELLDPSPVPTRKKPSNIDKWEEQSAGSQIVCFDNLSHIESWLSDAMCMAVTGDGVVKRKLYTDGDIHVSSTRAALILTTIGVGTLRGDLIDRMVQVELGAVKERLTEAQIRGWKDVHMAKVLGGYLDFLSAVLSVEVDDRVALPRMADFGGLLNRLDQVTGWNTLELFKEQRDLASFDAIEGDPFLSAVVKMVDRLGQYEGTAGELLSAVNSELDTNTARPKSWPPDAARVGQAISRGQDSLAQYGISVDRDRDKGKTRTRTIRLVKS